MRLNWLDWNEKSLLVNWMDLNGVCTASFQLIMLTRLVAIGNNFNSCTRNIQQVLIKPNYIHQSASSSLSSSSEFQYSESIKIENKSTPKRCTRYESLAWSGFSVCVWVNGREIEFCIWQITWINVRRQMKTNEINGH